MERHTNAELPATERVLRVLLVDDNASEASQLSEYLAATPGYHLTIVRAASLAGALSACQEVSFDAIILDPYLSDSQCADSIRGVRRAQLHTPLVVLTAIPDEELREAALADGAQEVLGKSDAQGALLARCILHTVDRWRVGEERMTMEAMLQCFPDALLVVDSGGMTRFFNSAAEELFGKTLENFVGNMTSLSSFPGSPLEIEVVHDDETRYAELRAVDIEWHNTPSRLAIIRDISEYKRLSTENQARHARAVEAISHQASGVAHDVMNLLTVVTGGMDMLQRDDVHEPQRHEFFTDMQLAIERATELSKQLLTFAQASLTKREICDLAVLLSASESLLRRLAGDNIHFAAEIGTQPFVIEANPSQINRIVLNLVVNARDAVDSGGRITVSLQRCNIADPVELAIDTLPAGAYAVLTVRDDGRGMDEATRSRIFEPLFTTKGGLKGSGLGLAVVYEIVRQNNGFIDVESELESGTTFSVFFPLACLPQ